MAKAYSYVRFSTPEQQQGDSFRRQTEMAARYAAAHGLELDRELTLHDLGVSAYRGANVETGALGAFMEAVRGGLVEPGSVLLVEALDRISRRTARRAVRVLEDIIDEGVDVVTLADGKRYSRDSLDGFDFLMAVLLLIRGHEESQTKSRRLKAAWEAKRARAAGGLLTSCTPGWIEVRDGRPSLVRERAAVVRRIFRMFLSGHGKHAIARALNEDGVPTFGRANQWHKSYVMKVLRNPAAAGTLTPHSLEHDGDGRRRRVPQEPVPGYFPAAVDGETFERARLLAGAGTPGRGRGVASLLARLARCPLCGSTMTRVTKGSRPRSGPPVLVCQRAKAGAGCRYRSVKVSAAEGALVAAASELAAGLPHPDESLQAELDGVENELHETGREIEALVDALARRPSEAVARRLQKLESKAAAVRKALGALQARAAQTESRLVRRRAERLEAALLSGDKRAANAALRECFESVVVDYERGELTCRWRHGGEFPLVAIL